MREFWLGCCAALACAGTAGAADLPVKAPLLKAPMTSYDWAGFYIGGNYALVAAQSTASTPGGPLGEVDLNARGLSVGIQAGYNWLFSPKFLAGVEVDFGYLGGQRKFTDWNDAAVTVGVEPTWYGTLRGRLGYVTGPSVIYATGGLAFVRLTDTFGTPASTLSTTRTGWTAGAGIETKLSARWSTTTEYLYVDAGRTSFPVIANTAPRTASFNHTFHVIKTGLNYQLHGPAEGLPFFTGNMLRPEHNWAGFYAGANAGLGLSLTNANAGGVTAVGTTDVNGAGATIGAHLGFNMMLASAWFAGAEGDVGYLGSSRGFREWNDGSIFRQNTSWYATLRGRFGRSTGPALLYVTGGAAWVGVEDGLTFIGTGETNVARRTASGWTVGGGTEVSLGGNWSGRLEYLYIDAGRRYHLLPTAGFDANFNTRFQLVRAGLNYHFNNPVVARY